MTLQVAEVTLILTHLRIRAALATMLSVAIGIVIWVLIKELGGEASDPAMTAILASMATGLVLALKDLIQAISADIQGYLKDRLDGKPPEVTP